VHDIAIFINDMSPDGLLRRLRLASELNLLLDADDNGGDDVSLLTFITAFTQSVKTVWDKIFHTEIQSQRRARYTPPKRTNRDPCRMCIAAFYKAKLLRGVPPKLQDDFEVFLRSLESVFLIDGDDKPATSTHPLDDRADPPPPLSSASVTNDSHNTRSSCSGIGSPKQVWARRLLL
jgi:hypothetical protein